MQQYTFGLPTMSSREARRAGRAMMQRQVRQEMRLADVDDETDVAILKNTNFTMVSANGIQSVGQIGVLQTTIEQMCPAVSARANMVADDHAFGVLETAQDHRRRIRRI